MDTGTPSDTEARPAAAGHADSAQPQAAVTPAGAPPAITPQASSRTRPALLAHLLKMADGYVKMGALQQAAELYFAIFENHNDAPEAAAARERLVQIANRHEKAGELHQARSIYERLL
jgi:thioredoxin-like negative regulator of GroEL